MFSPLGFGGGPLGGLFAPLDDETAAGALAAAWEGGVRYFDTAPHYGIGHSERRIGAFLRGRPRDEFTVSTKVGRLLVPLDPGAARSGAGRGAASADRAGGRGQSERSGPAGTAAAGRDDEHFAVPATHRRVWDFSRDGVRRSLEESLTRMGLDRVDVLYLHDAESRFEEALRDGYPALAELRAEGVVRAIGAGMHDTALLTTLVRETDVDVVMLAGRYTLLDQSALDTLLPACADRGVSLLAAAIFNSGVLATPRPAAGAHFDYSPAPAGLLRRAHRIADVCEAHGVTLPQAAMAFPLSHPSVAGIVVGMRSADEVRHNLASMAAPVPPAVWSDLRAEGLIDPRAPLPG